MSIGFLKNLKNENNLIGYLSLHRGEAEKIYLRVIRRRMGRKKYTEKYFYFLELDLNFYLEESDRSIVRDGRVVYCPEEKVWQG